MMLSIPVEIQAMAAALGVVALLFTWLLRGEVRRAGGRIDWWKAVEDTVAQFLLLTMLVTSVVQVVARYLFSDSLSLPWTEEFGRLVMVWAAMWGAAMLQRSDDHISMSVVYDLLPGVVQRFVRLVGDLVAIAVLVPVVWLGWLNARSLDIMFTISLGMPLSVFAYSVPVAGALMIVYSVALMVKRLLGRPIVSTQTVEL